MRFISNLNWIKKGVSKTPTRIKIDKDEMKELFKEIKQDNDEEDEREVDDEEEEEEEEGLNSSSNLDEESKINRKYKLDDYDDEEQELKMDKLTSLACFPSNEQDDYLNKKDDVRENIFTRHNIKIQIFKEL
jgi:hypothetical protein